MLKDIDAAQLCMSIVSITNENLDIDCKELRRIAAYLERKDSSIRVDSSSEAMRAFQSRAFRNIHVSDETVKVMNIDNGYIQALKRQYSLSGDVLELIKDSLIEK